MTADRKIVTALGFDDNAEEAVDFYCSLFADSRIVDVTRNTAAGPGEAGGGDDVRDDPAGYRDSAARLARRISTGRELAS